MVNQSTVDKTLASMLTVPDGGLAQGLDKGTVITEDMFAESNVSNPFAVHATAQSNLSETHPPEQTFIVHAMQNNRDNVGTQFLAEIHDSLGAKLHEYGKGLENDARETRDGYRDAREALKVTLDEGAANVDTLVFQRQQADTEVGTLRKQLELVA